jgi:hypothetical protein
LLDLASRLDAYNVPEARDFRERARSGLARLIHAAGVVMTR